MGGKSGSRMRGVSAALSRTFSKEHMKELFSARTFTAGGYTAAVCVVAIAVACAAVLAVQALPSTYTEIDLSQSQTTSISDETKERLSALEEDVEIYLVAEEGEEDDLIVTLLGKFADASDHVSVEQKDPVLYPAFTSQYTSDDLTDNSLIVVCGDDYQIVDYYDIYTLNSSTYSYEFGGESAVVSAITALTGEDLPVVYLLTGHGEADIPTDVTSSIEKANFQTEELNLLSEDAVPEDADAVIMYAPTSDLSEDECDKLLEYLEEGGSFLLVSDYDIDDTPNLDEVMDTYGLQSVDGIVVEGDNSQYLSGYPYYLLPTIGTHDITEDIADGNSYVLVPLAHGIAEVDSYRSTLTITPLLSTSSQAYVKTDPSNAETLEQEDGDVAGSTMVGVAVSEEVSDEEETRVVWFSSSSFLESQIDQVVGGTNSTLFVDSITWLADASDVVTSSTESKSLGTTYITVDASSAALLNAFVVGVVPLFFLLWGFSIWRRRRKG